MPGDVMPHGAMPAGAMPAGAIEVGARRAVGSDEPEVDRLAAAALDAVRGERGGEQWLATAAPGVPGSRGVPGVGDGTEWLVGCIDDVPLGVLAATPVRWPDGRLVVRVDVLWVEPDAREVGIGEALVDAAVDLAHDVGAIALEGLALPGQRELKNLFERFGLVARAIVVHKALPPR